MRQDSFLTLAAGFLLGVLVTVVAGGAFFQVRMVTERERAERAEEEAEKERDRADDLENQVRGYRLEAELAAQEKTVQKPLTPKVEDDKKQIEEDEKRAYKEFWDAVEQERKKKQGLLTPPSSSGKGESQR
jgi:uncharacterized protein HemX